MTEATSKRPLTDVRGSVYVARYRTARVSKRFYDGSIRLLTCAVQCTSCVTKPRASSTLGDDRKASSALEDDRGSCTLETSGRNLPQGWPCTGEHRLEEHRTGG